MADTRPHSTLRELRRQLSDPRLIGILLAVALVLTLVAPFDTDRHLGPLPRAAFWLGIVALTYATGALTDGLLRAHLRDVSATLRVAALAVATGITVALVVEFVTWALFGLPGSTGMVWRDLATNFAIGVAVSAAIQIGASGTRPAPAPDTPAPAILDRLPLDKRGALIALSVEDHYVRVRTTGGEEMLLLRLSDAMRETVPTPGLRVHRSHWVATDAVAAVRRDGDRAILTMRHGGDIPASRSHIADLKEAGLLPR